MTVMMATLGMVNTAWTQTPAKVSTQAAKTAKAQPTSKSCKFPRYAAPDVANVWRELEWSGLSAAELDNMKNNVWRVFQEQHPKCSKKKELCRTALSKKWLDLTVHVYLQGSERWTAYTQLANYFILTRNYYRQARINLKFKCSTPPQRVHTKARNENIIAFKFGKSILNPNGDLKDGFGNLPLGLAALNDRIMNRTGDHKNPYFLPGKPIGHEIGHVLGLSHVDELRNLMSQGTSPRNQLVIEPVQAVIMRTLALSRFGAKVGKKPKW